MMHIERSNIEQIIQPLGKKSENDKHTQSGVEPRSHKLCWDVVAVNEAYRCVSSAKKWNAEKYFD